MAVTPVRTGPFPRTRAPSPEIRVLNPTSTPATSVMASLVPGVPSKGTPKSRARGSGPLANAAEVSVSQAKPSSATNTYCIFVRLRVIWQKGSYGQRTSPSTRFVPRPGKLNYRWMHPGQQQGRRFPSLRLEQHHPIRRLLVSAFLADSIQQIHSLRASGVMASQVANAGGFALSVLFKSAGISCTTPLEIFLCAMNLL